MLTLYYTPGTCALAVRIARPEEAAAPPGWCAWTSRQASSARQSTWPSTLAGGARSWSRPQGTPDRNARPAGVCGQTFQAGLAPADPYGFARLQGVSQRYLASTVHVARPPPPRQPLGRQARGPGRHAAQRCRRT